MRTWHSPISVVSCYGENMTSDHPQAMGRLEWFLLVFLSVIWGASFFFFKVLVAELPPFTIVLGRVALAALILYLYMLVRGERMPTNLTLWGEFFISGALNNVIPFSLIVYGESRISSGLASIINATTPFFTIIVAHYLTHNEKLSWNKTAGVAFGILGVAILTGPGVLGHGGDPLGEFCCVAAAVSYAFASVFARRFKAIPPLKVATGQLTASTILLIPLAAVADQPWGLAMPSLQAWGAWLGLSILGTALAFLIYFHILAKSGATNSALVTFLSPVSAVLLGVAFLGERLEISSIAGMLVITLGLAAIDGRPVQWLRRSLQA